MGGLDKLKGFSDRLNNKETINMDSKKSMNKRSSSVGSFSALSFNRNIDMRNFKDPLAAKIIDDSKYISPGNVNTSSNGTPQTHEQKLMRKNTEMSGMNSVKTRKSQF
jgi:hypothetical protein